MSLYVVSVRWGVFDPSVLGPNWVFQKTSLPEKKARLTPWSRAAVTLARWLPLQYSSWPVDMNILWLSRRDPEVSTSVAAR